MTLGLVIEIQDLESLTYLLVVIRVGYLNFTVFVPNVQNKKSNNLMGGLHETVYESAL